MSISAMKQALEALALVASSDEWLGCQTYEGQIATSAHEALSQAIAEAEKQEPVAFRNTETGEFCTGGFLRKDLAKWQPVYTTPVACDDDIYDIWVEQKPVHASDISQEPVDETAKDRHEPSDYDKSIHSNPDAQAWAKFFMATVKEQEWCIDDIDEDLMLGWFANAMMAMHDHVKREWVGLTDEAIWLEYQHLWPFHPAEEPTLAKDIAKFARAIEAKLKEKNNG